MFHLSHSANYTQFFGGKERKFVLTKHKKISLQIFLYRTLVVECENVHMRMWLRWFVHIEWTDRINATFILTHIEVVEELKWWMFWEIKIINFSLSIFPPADLLSYILNSTYKCKDVFFSIHRCYLTFFSYSSIQKSINLIEVKQIYFFEDDSKQEELEEEKSRIHWIWRRENWIY